MIVDSHGQGIILRIDIDNQYKIITQPMDSTSIIAGATDMDLKPLDIQWVQTSGPVQATMINDTTSTLILEDLTEAGVYHYTITVKDDDGEEKSYSATVRVRPASNFTIEAEDAYSVIADAGSNSIQVDAANNASNGEVVRIFDVGDKIQIPFNVGNYTPKDFDLKVRLKSGTTANPTEFWDSGYSFTLNGEEIELIGDESTLTASSYQSGSYWGKMVSERLTATQSTQLLEITSNIAGAAVDYIELKVYTGDSESNENMIRVLVNPTISVTLPLDTLTIDGSVSTSYSDPESVNILWSQKSGPSKAVLANETSKQVKIANLEAGIYEFTLEASDGNYNSDYEQVTVTVNPGETYSAVIEAEDNFSVLSDPGNYTISTNNNSNFSGGGTLLMYNKGDKARFTFDVPTTSYYILNVRLRSGNSASSNSYFSNGYQFFLDDTETTFTGDNSTIEHTPSAYGDSYFGTMVSGTVTLSAGEHHLDIQTVASWAVIDYIEVIEVDASSSRIASDGLISETATEDSNKFIVYPNPTQGSFSINYKAANDNSTISLNILDSTGKLILKESYNSEINKDFNLTGYARGMYFILVKSGTETFSKKIILD